ncbi:hypothetical protein V2H45_08055 [Tumidithrix elongata RA019]|uniref:Uncharacterized protein n=1 Tax=Tumidithrix elongata BACA0141 TaxID=2716417 RepID=A0AAW9PZT7_9CYAN|nr:hypothetical protein [Tumidithrix elongata RA019]
MKLSPVHFRADGKNAQALCNITLTVEKLGLQVRSLSHYDPSAIADTLLKKQ